VNAPQCALLASNLVDNFRLTVDQFGNIVGVDYRTATVDCSPNAEPTVSFLLPPLPPPSSSHLPCSALTPSPHPPGSQASKFDTKVGLTIGAEAAK
jgi:hypothetical protein